jgi:uncharacterized protein (TIGR02186 family)
MTAASACRTLTALFVMLAAVPARAERLIASLSNRTVEITSSFAGVELVLFGTVEGDDPTDPPQRGYDIVATATGPRQTLVTWRKQRIFGIWVNADSRTLPDVPSYLSVLSTRPYDEIANHETLRREEIGIDNAVRTQKIGGLLVDVPADDEFRQAFLRLERDHRLYGETTDAVKFLTPTLYRASIFVPAEAEVGTYNVEVKLFADGAMIARTDERFDIVTVGFEHFIAGAAVDHGILYGLVTAAMAAMTGWFASIVFRRD